MFPQLSVTLFTRRGGKRGNPIPHPPDWEVLLISTFVNFVKKCKLSLNFVVLILEMLKMLWSLFSVLWVSVGGRWKI